MTNTQPTPAELTRAAEIAPMVAAIVGTPELEVDGQLVIWVERTHKTYCVSPLDPRAFRQVLLALPLETQKTLLEALEVAHTQRFYLERSIGDRMMHFAVWLLTPAGMIATYEALVALEGECDPRDDD